MILTLEYGIQILVAALTGTSGHNTTEVSICGELILKSVTCLRTFVCHILFITVNCWRSKIISAPSGPSWGSSGNSKSFSKKNLNSSSFSFFS